MADLQQGLMEINFALVYGADCKDGEFHGKPPNFRCSFFAFYAVEHKTRDIIGQP